jgi:hypothetical protein
MNGAHRDAIRRQRRGIEPMLVNRHPDQRRAGRAEGGQRRDISRIFNHHVIARIEQQTRADIQRLLRAARHHDVVGRARDAASGSNTVGDLLAQPRISGRRAIPERSRP